MYEWFEVKNFRCFPELSIGSLERVNLIAGANNVGKTALLEGIFIHGGAYNPELSLRVNALRGISVVKIELVPWVESPWASLYNKFDISKKIELVAQNTVSGRRSMTLKVVRDLSELEKIAKYIPYPTEQPKEVLGSSQIPHVLELEYEEKEQHGSFYMVPRLEGGFGIVPTPPPPPPFQTTFQLARMPLSFRTEAERFGHLEVHGQQDVLLKVLEIIEPRLSRLTIVVVADQPILHGDIGIGRLIPLPVMGEGMARLASLVLQISNAPKGVVLIDEIENGLHHSILAKVWQAIGIVARKFNTQVFATTHSWECIVAAHKAFREDSQYDFRLHRLERTKETIRSVTYDQETLEAAIKTGLEVR